ncbi:kinase-like domain-containing protein [Melanogaster broomeanus]|nr:kinase-like domain-containing protein [Melanogaster broomeanus]
MTPFIPVRVDGRFRPKETLGAGSYATVYKALNIINNKVYAIKLQLCLRDTGESSVEREYRVLKQLEGGAGIPCAHWFGRESCYDALVLDLLGPSLHDLLTQKKRFCLRTVVHLGDQLVSHLEYIHSQNYVHCDIKPQNVLTGLGDQVQNLFLVNFGVAKQYRNSLTGDHIPFHQAHHLTGTPAFASINSHLGAELGRRDDLESLAYMLTRIYFLRGSLPWLNSDGKKLQTSRILELKQMTPVDILCNELPREFATILIYAHTLSFSETPHYDYIQSLLSGFHVKDSTSETCPPDDLDLYRPLDSPKKDLECSPPTPLSEKSYLSSNRL